MSKSGGRLITAAGEALSFVEALARARDDALEEAAKIAHSCRAQTLRLHLGEMTAQEARTCGALVDLICYRIRALKTTPEKAP